MTKAILLVSFGTSYTETREKTLDQIKQDVVDAYPKHPVSVAWTSDRIRKKILERDGIAIPGVTEALEEMLAEGITDVVIQPTHMLNGFEYEKIRNRAEAYQDKFHSMVFSTPLLTEPGDYEDMVHWIKDTFPLKDDEALVLMGHGTEHQANETYGRMARLFREYDMNRVFLGTVDASPSIDDILEQLRQQKSKKVYLSPFLVVAGDHALHDMTGSPESWENRIKDLGCSVQVILKGLGEYPRVRKLYLKHLKKTM